MLENGRPRRIRRLDRRVDGPQGGGSAHEVRTWIAAFASLAAGGAYEMSNRFYDAIPEWIAGFAVATAAQR